VVRGAGAPMSMAPAGTRPPVGCTSSRPRTMPPPADVVGGQAPSSVESLTSFYLPDDPRRGPRTPPARHREHWPRACGGGRVSVCTVDGAKRVSGAPRAPPERKKEEKKDRSSPWVPRRSASASRTQTRKQRIVEVVALLSSICREVTRSTSSSPTTSYSLAEPGPFSPCRPGARSRFSRPSTLSSGRGLEEIALTRTVSAGAVPARKLRKPGTPHWPFARRPAGASSPACREFAFQPAPGPAVLCRSAASSSASRADLEIEFPPARRRAALHMRAEKVGVPLGVVVSPPPCRPAVRAGMSEVSSGVVTPAPM